VLDINTKRNAKISRLTGSDATPIESVNKVKFLGVTWTNDFKWKNYVKEEDLHHFYLEMGLCALVNPLESLLCHNQIAPYLCFSIHVENVEESVHGPFKNKKSESRK
jgi:hypothetical protein